MAPRPLTTGNSGHHNPSSRKQLFLNKTCKKIRDSSTTSVREPPPKDRIIGDSITPADTKLVCISVQIHLYKLIISPHLQLPYIFEAYYFSSIASTVHIRRCLVQQVLSYPAYLSSLLHLFRSYITCEMLASITSRQIPYMLENQSCYSKTFTTTL